jgi:hypothetical protein
MDVLSHSVMRDHFIKSLDVIGISLRTGRVCPRRTAHVCEAYGTYAIRARWRYFGPELGVSACGGGVGEAASKTGEQLREMSLQHLRHFLTPR